MKQLFITIISFLLTSFSIKAQPTQKIQAIFNISFPQATEIVWQQKDNTYSSSFKQDDMLYIMHFESDGNLLSSVRRSDEKGLPANLLYNFKKKHNDKKIATVAQIINEEGTLYYITAQDEKFIYWFKGNTYSEINLDQKLPK